MHTHTDTPEPPAQTEGRLIRWAAWYDALTNLLTLGYMGRLRSLTVDRALLQPGDSVLDVGCGTGAVAIPAKIRVGESGSVAGIDPAPEMIAVARRKAQRAGIEIDFRIGVIESLPYPDETFDVVTSSLMMHHLPEHLQMKGLAEIRRALKPGGRILIVDLLSLGASLHKGLFTWSPLHHRHGAGPGIEELPKLLREAGFEEVEQLEDRFPGIGFVRAKKPAA
jgi:ubiquinone/menaquinone biosynthesis C-methylase UbiE